MDHSEAERIIRSLFQRHGRRFDCGRDAHETIRALYAPPTVKFLILNTQIFQTFLRTFTTVYRKYRLVVDWYDLTGTFPLCDVDDQDGRRRFVWLVFNPERLNRLGPDPVALLRELTPPQLRDSMLVLRP